MPTLTDMQAVIGMELEQLLNARYPKTICPSEVARKFNAATLQAYGASNWRDLMPKIREKFWEMRENGEVEILQRGEVVPDDVALEDIKGPIRARRSLD